MEKFFLNYSFPTCHFYNTKKGNYQLLRRNKVEFVLAQGCMDVRRGGI